MDAWGAEGKMNPFKDRYDLVSQMTVRVSSCKGLTINPVMIKKKWLEAEKECYSRVSPSWSLVTGKEWKKVATTGVYNLLSHYLDVWRKAEVPSLDAIDILISDGEDNLTKIAAGFICQLQYSTRE